MSIFNLNTVNLESFSVVKVYSIDSHVVKVYIISIILNYIFYLAFENASQYYKNRNIDLY